VPEEASNRMNNLRNMKTDVSDVVARSVTNTFGVMFRRDVAPEGFGEGFVPPSNGEICSSVRLWQDGKLDLDFYFVFNSDLLTAIVKESYPAETQDNVALAQDIACAVANIVVSNVKTYLNGRGFEMTMELPEAGKPQENGAAGQAAHLKFRCNSDDDGILVNMSMQDRSGPKAG
jgi:hypothetical protein